MYIVIELQTNEAGQVANIVTQHETGLEAESKYHAILSAAAISSVPIHSAIILDEKGERYAGQYYDHRTQPQPDEDELI